MRRAALVALGAVVAAGCGAGDDPSVTVAAASSLTGPLTQCARGIDGLDVRLEFGGSDDLAAQVRQGVAIDVFASADTRLPGALAAQGRAQAPVAFAANEVVLAVPRDSDIRALDDLASARDARLVVGSPDVPVGRYARAVLDRLPARERAAIEARVRSEEPDVNGIVGKLAAGAADAGFVYRTDVLAAGPALRAVGLPARLRPTVVYGLSIVREGDRADRVVQDVLRGGCAEALRAAGFGPAPG
ncbi:MAG TPA: molybdate ABC transporter substrate-binding protein [Solirubrobacteraceae bacterium]|nr:molybdate ABC transporter substrate-binding protein [Solirubrobacteraceae bacterium]